MKRLLPYFIALFFVAACGSSNEEPEPTTPTGPQNLIALVTTTAAPGQLVIAKADTKPAITNSSTIKVGGQEVMAIAGDSNQVMFILPILPVGKVAVDYKGIGIDKQLELTVGAYSAITDPAAIASAFAVELGQVVARFQDYVKDPVVKLDPAYIEILSDYQKIIADNFAKLTPQEQLEAAYLLRALMPNDIDFILPNHDPANYRRGMIDPEDEWWRARGFFYGSMVGGALTFRLAHQLIQKPILTPFQGYALLACGAASVTFIVVAHSEAENVAEVKARIEKIKEYFFGGRQGTVGVSAYRQRAGEIEFTQGKPKTLNLKGDFRTMAQADKGSSPIYTEVFNKIAVLEEWHNTLVAVRNKIKSLFSSSAADMPNYKNPIKAQATMKEFILNNEKVTLKNLSDASIKLTYAANADGGFSIATTRDAVGLQDRPFTFDIVFTQSKLENVKTNTVYAIYKPTQPQTVSILDGNSQIAEPGKQLSKPLQVKVADSEGKPLKNIELEWSVKTGGGSLSVGKSITDAQGVAQVSWTMKADATGDQKVEATVKRGDGTLVTGAPLTFIAYVDKTLLGKWRMVRGFNGTWHETNDIFMYFESNGKVTVTSSDKTDVYTYTYNEGKNEIIMVLEDPEETLTTVFKINKFTTTELTLQWENPDSGTIIYELNR